MGAMNTSKWMPDKTCWSVQRHQRDDGEEEREKLWQMEATADEEALLGIVFRYRDGA